MSKHIANVIKNIRIAHGLTQEQLAEMIDRSPGHVGMLEQGRATPSYDVMEKLITEFDVDANLFFGGAPRDAESISMGIVQTVQNMPSQVQECLMLYAQIIDQFSKGVRGSNEGPVDSGS